MHCEITEGCVCFVSLRDNKESFYFLDALSPVAVNWKTRLPYLSMEFNSLPFALLHPFLPPLPYTVFS